MKNLLLFFILLFGKSLFSQSFTSVSGKIIDNITKQPLEGVYIGIPAKGANTSSIGVITNAAGEFVLKYPILLQATGSLIITKIDFKNIRKNLLEFKDKKDSLIFEFESVDKKSIEPRDGKKTIEYVIARIEKNYNTNPYFMYGFYQEYLSWDSTYVKIAEGVLKTEKYPFPEKGNLGEVSKLMKGRSYEKNERKDEWGNLEFSNGADLVTRTIETKNPDFLDKANLKNYKFQINTELSEYDGMPVFNISFSPIDKKVRGGKIGKMQIDTLTMGILALEYEFTSEGLKDIMGGSAFGGNQDAKVKTFKIAQYYHAALNNYYLHQSTFKIEAEVTQNKVKIPASLNLSFSATEANTRMGFPIKDNEILEDTNFPNGGKKHDDSFWGNFNYIKPTEEFRKIIR